MAFPFLFAAGEEHKQALPFFYAADEEHKHALPFFYAAGEGGKQALPFFYAAGEVITSAQVRKKAPLCGGRLLYSTS